MKPEPDAQVIGVDGLLVTVTLGLSDAIYIEQALHLVSLIPNIPQPIADAARRVWARCAESILCANPGVSKEFAHAQLVAQEAYNRQPEEEKRNADA